MTAAATGTRRLTARERELRAQARAGDRAVQDAADAGAEDARAGRPAEVPFGMDSTAYLAGYDQAKADRPAPTKARTKAGAEPKSSTSAKRTTRPKARRRPSRARRQATRAVTAPIERQAMSGAAALGTVLALAVLYNVLANADAAAGVIAGAARVVKWLDSPTSIPYGGK